MNNFLKTALVSGVFSFLYLTAFSNTTVSDYNAAKYTPITVYSSAKYTSTDSIMYIYPVSTIVKVITPSLVTTQIFLLPGSNNQSVVIYGENMTTNVNIRNADAEFCLGNKDIWKATFINNRWTEESRLDIKTE